ncbi:hypothetical protein BDW72DRAFT_212680 [Aspergillus terricola var. indicus]
MEELDSEFEKSDDEFSSGHLRRNKRPEISKWAMRLIEEFGRKYMDQMTKQLHSNNPNFDEIEALFDELNVQIRSENERHQAPLDQNAIQTDMYRRTYDSFVNYLKLGHVSSNPQEQWKAFYIARGMFKEFNRQNCLPGEWNIPESHAERELGPRPPGVDEAPDDDDGTDSAVSYSSEEESEEDDVEGIDALETRMRKEYSSLSRGKVLYWWPVGTGTQIFVRYGPKTAPIYRVRAGSSMPWDPRTAEQVLSRTPGNSKVILKTENGEKKETWKYSRQHVLDIIGVGWKVEGDDDASGHSLALIRPVKDASYPHTRVLVKWRDSKISLERRGFVRRIANGNSINGDRMIFLKAKEMENAYWGYDVEASDEESSGSDSSSSDESDYPHTRSRRRNRQGRTRSAKRDISSTESDETEDSDIEAEKRKRQARWNRRKKTRPKNGPDTDDDIRHLEKELKLLKLKKSRKKSTTSRKTRRNKT